MASRRTRTNRLKFFAKDNYCSNVPRRREEEARTAEGRKFSLTNDAYQTYRRVRILGREIVQAGQKEAFAGLLAMEHLPKRRQRRQGHWTASVGWERDPDSGPVDYSATYAYALAIVTIYCHCRCSLLCPPSSPPPHPPDWNRSRCPTRFPVHSAVRYCGGSRSSRGAPVGLLWSGGCWLYYGPWIRPVGPVLVAVAAVVAADGGGAAATGGGGLTRLDGAQVRCWTEANERAAGRQTCSDLWRIWAGLCSPGHPRPGTLAGCPPTRRLHWNC